MSTGSQFTDSTNTFCKLLEGPGYVLDVILLAANAGHRIRNPFDRALLSAVKLADIGVHAGRHCPEDGVPFLAIEFDPGTFITTAGIDPGHGRVGLAAGCPRPEILEGLGGMSG